MSAVRVCLAVCAAVLWSSGCATAASHEQIVSLDSAPRGAVVTRTVDGAVVGTTPLLLTQPRAATQDYSVAFADGGAAHVVTACEARTAFLIADAIPGLPLLVLPPPLNVVGFIAMGATLSAVDTDDGAVFDCPAALLVQKPGMTSDVVAADVLADVEFAALPGLVVDGCPRYLVVPPVADSEAASRQLTRAVSDALAKVNECATVVDATDAASAFSRKNVSWQRPLLRDRFVRAHVHDVAFTTRASHLVQLEVVDGAARLRVTDVHTLQAAAGPALTLPTTRATAERDLFHELLLWGVGLIPDTFVWNAAAKAFPFQPTTGEAIVKQEFTNPFLASAINFQLYHLDHPENHAPWDFTLTVGPDMLVLLNGTRMILENDDGQRRTLTLTVIQAVLPISPRVTFFTPAGVTAVWAGVGPGLVIDWDEPAYDFSARLTAFAHGGISHNVFLTRTIFVGVAAHGNRSFWPHVQRDGVKLDWFFQAQANLGISFPDFTDDIADWL